MRLVARTLSFGQEPKSSPKRSRDGGSYKLWLCYGGKSYEEHSVGEIFQEICSSLQPKTGLAGTTWSGEGKQAHLLAAYSLCDLPNLALPTHKSSGLEG